MGERLGEIGLFVIFVAILVLLVPGWLGFGGTWSLVTGIWLGIIAVFLMRADRARERRREDARGGRSQKGK